MKTKKSKPKRICNGSLKKLLTRFVQEDAQAILQKWTLPLIREMVTLKDFEPFEFISLSVYRRSFHQKKLKRIQVSSSKWVSHFKKRTL